ncbi:hypothetical protein ACSBR2_029512 [Camellia fascicularis]
MVTIESKGISYPIRVVKCIEQRHGHHSVKVANGSKSWFANGSHGRVEQSSMFKQMDMEEDNAVKDGRNNDVEVRGEVEKTQWIDMEVKGLIQGGNCNSHTVSIVDETATKLENQTMTEGGVGQDDSGFDQASVQIRDKGKKVFMAQDVIDGEQPFLAKKDKGKNVAQVSTSKAKGKHVTQVSRPKSKKKIRGVAQFYRGFPRGAMFCVATSAISSSMSVSTGAYR